MGREAHTDGPLAGIAERRSAERRIRAKAARERARAELEAELATPLNEALPEDERCAIRRLCGTMKHSLTWFIPLGRRK